MVAFVLLRNSRFSFHCYTQREATTTKKSARKWRCDLSRLLARKITKGIRSRKPASLNRPIIMLLIAYMQRYSLLWSRLPPLLSHVILKGWLWPLLRLWTFIEVLYLAYSSVWLLHGWCHVKLLPSGSTFCVHHTTMHHGLQCHFLQRHIRKVPVYLAVTRHLAPGSFMCYCGNTGVERTPK